MARSSARRITCGLAIAAMLLLLHGTSGEAPASSAQGTSADWAALGPPGPAFIRAIGVSPDWPEDRFLVATGDGVAIRSFDGGSSWEPIAHPRGAAPPRGHEVLSLIVAPGTSVPRTVFAIVGPPHRYGTTIVRSVDEGASWTRVLAGVQGDNVQFSSDFSQDGTAFVRTGSQLMRTVDRGATWQPVEINVPLPELDEAGESADALESSQLLADAVISPNFARDQTLFVPLVSDYFRSGRGRERSYEVSTDHERSLGVAVSRDGGESWEPISRGLEVEGVPYRHVQHLAISPTFAEDGMVFAFAWGPRAPSTPFPQTAVFEWTGALFRSSDRGESWELLRTYSDRSNNLLVKLALSPSFATDGIALMAQSGLSVTPSQSRCYVEVSRSWGEEWEPVGRTIQSESCHFARLLDQGVGFVLRGVRLPEMMVGEARISAVGVMSPYPTRDGTVFVATPHDGVRALGPSARSTFGKAPCSISLMPEFEGVWREEWRVARLLGCPSSPGGQLRVRMQERRIWIEDSGEDWYEMLEDGRLDRKRKSSGGWPDEPEHVVDVTAQRFPGWNRFETAYMLLIPGERKGRILVLGDEWGRHRLWMEFDSPSNPSLSGGK